MDLSPDIESLCIVLRTACRIDDAAGGTIHLISEDGCTLAAQHDLPDPFAAAFHSVEDGDGTTISQVCAERHRVVVRDVRADPSFAPYRQLAAGAGIVGIQSTPVNSDSTRMHGVLTTYFSRPHHPGPESLKRLDYCASIAAKILVTTELEHAIGNGRALSGIRPNVTHAAAAVQMLLPACEKEPASELLLATDRKLTVVLEALMERAPPLPPPEQTEPIDELHCNEH